MKRRLLDTRFLKRTALAVPAAALMLGSSNGAQIGINFQDNYNGNAYAPLTAASAFGIPLANWFNAPSINNSDANPVSTSANFAVPGAGNLNVAWSCKNTWSLYAAIPGTGDNQVIYGYLDDTDYGYTVTLTGFRGFASDFTIQGIATSDGASGFQDVNVTSKTDTNTLQYLDLFTPDFANGLWSTSTVSAAFVTLNGNDSVTIKGLPRSGTVRSCLAGLLIDFTPGANTPLIEVNPTTPVGNVYPGGSFVLDSLASGSPTLYYQWRKDGTNIVGANFPNYTNSSAAVGDTGNYDVVVTNSLPNGAVTSTVAHVTILNVVPPVITQSPLSQTLYTGYPAMFSVAATGGSLTYQWKSNTVAIPGATNTTYTIASVTTNSAATYTIEVSNPVGPTVTASATLTVKVPASGSYEQAVASTKPALWFRYSETDPRAVVTGTAANSGSTGAADNGVAKYYTSFQQPGAIVGDTNKSASFNGSQAIDVPYDAALNSATFTVELWANPAAVNTAGAQSPLYNRGAASGDGWLFWANNATTSWQFRTYTGATRNTVNSTDPAVAGVWTHLVGVYDGTTTHFYVNGVEQGTGLAGAFTPNSSIPLRVGGAGNDTGTPAVNAWVGGVDEVAIYSTVLSPADILAHYQNGTNAARGTPYNVLVQASAPAGYWRLNDAAGLVPPTPKNSGTLGAAFDGAYGGDITPNTIGPRPPTEPGLEATNIAVSMVNGYSTSPQLPLNVNTVTVTCWINRADTFTTGDLGWPAWLGGGGMHLNDGIVSSEGPYAELRYHWNGNNWGWSSGLVVPPNVWTFCALVVEPTKATMYMSDGTTLLTSVDNSAHAPMIVLSQPGFGGNQPGSPTRNYIGQLDETTVYDRALTSSEINTLFLVGTGAKLQLQLNRGGIIEDSNPVSTTHPGVNTELSCAWLASNTDSLSKTRTGVEQFATTNQSQIVIPAADTDLNPASGTIMFWMQANAPIPGPGNEAAMLFDHRTTSGTVIVLNDAGAIFVQCSGGANSLSAGYLPDGNWHHVAVTYDQSTSGSVAIYVDGASQASQANTAAWSWPTAQQIELGRSHDAYWKRYDGLMDDFRIYNRILTDTEITSVYTSDAVVDPAALKLRYNFTTVGIGQTVSWPFGTLLSSPVLGPAANWQPVTGAAPPNYPFLPTGPSLFFRATP